MPRRREKRSEAARGVTLYEAEVVPGLEKWTAQELESKLNVAGDIQRFEGALRFYFRGDATRLLDLTTVQAIYHVEHFDIPRPKAFLGDQHFRKLTGQLSDALRLHSADSFHSFSIAAAGSQSSVMVRLRNAIADALYLESTADAGDLTLRLIRPRERKEGWEAIVRLSPRPLGTRSWRVCNMEGALNATVARVMVLMSRPEPQHHCINIGCGSGTLIIERLSECDAEVMVGCDIDAEALRCSQINISQIGFSNASLHQWDATQLPIKDGALDVAFADLPFGNLVGSHDTNVTLYPAVLTEVSRIIRAGGRFVIITHEVKLMTTVLETMQDVWHVHHITQIDLSGLHPRIYELHRL